MNQSQNNQEINTAKKKRSVLAIILDVVFYSALVLIIVSAVRFSRSSDPEKSIFGYRYFNILTTSMQDVIPRGSLAFVKQVDPKTLQVGDDITFYQDDVTTITHRINRIEENYLDTQQRAFYTKGTQNRMEDAAPVLENRVIGIVTFHIPGIGFLLEFIAKNAWQAAIAVAVIVLFLISSVMLMKMLIEEKRAKKAAGLPSQRLLQSEPQPQPTSAMDPSVTVYNPRKTAESLTDKTTKIITDKTAESTPLNQAENNHENSKNSSFNIVELETVTLTDNQDQKNEDKAQTTHDIKTPTANSFNSTVNTEAELNHAPPSATAHTSPLAATTAEPLVSATPKPPLPTTDARLEQKMPTAIPKDNRTSASGACPVNVATKNIASVNPNRFLSQEEDLHKTVKDIMNLSSDELASYLNND